jgi:hypothetical protein
MYKKPNANLRKVFAKKHLSVCISLFYFSQVVHAESFLRPTNQIFRKIMWQDQPI